MMHAHMYTHTYFTHTMHAYIYTHTVLHTHTHLHIHTHTHSPHSPHSVTMVHGQNRVWTGDQMGYLEARKERHGKEE